MKPLVLSILGAPVAIDFDETVTEEARLLVRSQWEHLATEASAEGRLTVTMDMQRAIDAGPFAKRRTPDEVARNVAGALTGMAVVIPSDGLGAGAAQPDDRHVAITAGAVAVTSGTYAGKAVLLLGARPHEEARALAGGYDYLGAEVAALNVEDRTVRGLPAPLRTEPGYFAALAAPAAFGLAPEAGPRAACAIVRLVPQAEGEAGWSTATVPEIAAAAAPLVPLATTAERPLSTVAELIGGFPVLATVHYTKDEELPGLLDQVLQESAPPRPATTAVESRPVEDGTIPQLGDVRRSAMIDAIGDGQTLAVIDDQYRAQVVQGVGLAIWESAGSWIGIDDLTARVVELVGEPDGDARALVAAAVDALVAQEILVRV